LRHSHTSSVHSFPISFWLICIFPLIQTQLFYVGLRLILIFFVFTRAHRSSVSVQTGASPRGWTCPLMPDIVTAETDANPAIFYGRGPPLDATAPLDSHYRLALRARNVCSPPRLLTWRRRWLQSVWFSGHFYHKKCWRISPRPFFLLHQPFCNC